MPTIKDVAAAAGVSPTTVSLVMNGHGPENRIPKETIERVHAAMRELGYQPNLSARRLRNSAERKPVIAFYWPLDYRAHMMGFFLSLIQNALKDKSFDCEVLLHPYINDHIEEACTPLLQNNYSGAIISAASEQDVRMLEQMNIQMPLVLINRESNKYTAVGVNSNKAGLLAASLIRQKGYSQIAVIGPDNHYFAASRRTEAFRFACKQLGIQIPDEWFFTAPNTPEDGALAAEKVCALSTMPKMLFCESDAMIPGILYTFHRYGVLIPQDMELLCFSTKDPKQTKYLVPSVSIIAMPSDEIIQQSLSALIVHITTGSREPMRIECEARVELRDTFRL